MGRRTPVGVLNGNFRDGDWYQYHQSVRRGWNTEELQRMMTKKKMRAMYWTQRLCNAMGMLKNADPMGWEAWYDNDANVPAEGHDRDFAWLVEARVKELTGSYPKFTAYTRRDIFIWKDEIGFYVYSKEVGKKPLYILDFNNFEDAEKFVRGLPTHNCGYGVVLDLLPAAMLGGGE